MSEYVLDTNLDQDKFKSLDAFTQGYIEVAFWTGDEEIADMGFHDLAPEALQSIIETCDDFQQACQIDLENYQTKFNLNHAGHDFWLTRNRHGAGFWDRGLGDIGKRLTDMAHPYGWSDLYVGDDGKIYVT